MFVLLLIVLTVLWGNTLGQRAQASAVARIRERAQRLPETLPWIPATVPQIHAVPLPIDAASPTDSAVAEARRMLASSGDALTFLLYRDGAVLYDSETARAAGIEDAGSSGLSLTRLGAAIHAAGGYSCALMRCDWQQHSHAAARREAAVAQAAIAAEMAQSGMDEVLLLGLTVSPQTLSEVILFLAELRRTEPGAVVGIALSCTDFSAYRDAGRITSAGDDLAALLCSLTAYVDFCALDLSDAACLTDPGSDAVTPENLIPRIGDAAARYRLRLLLPPSLYPQDAVWEERGFFNRLLLPAR